MSSESRHPGLRFDELKAVSVLSGDRTSVGFGSEVLEVGRVAGVLYLPELLLQLAPGRVVPLEAIQHEWSLQFELGRDFQGRTAAYREPFEIDELDEDVCILANFYSRNFFHWITEELVKVAVLERSGFTGRYVLSALPAFAGQFLEFMGVSADRLIGRLERPTRFRSASYVTAITALQLDRYPSLFAGLREMILASVGPSAGASRRRLWMDRRLGVNNAGRELLNPDEVYPLIERYGFEVVDMAAHAVPEQIRLANSAAVLSGPHGAGFIHTMFMQPRSTVIECFSPLFINPGVYEICRLLRHRYSMVVYENCYEGYPYGNRLMVNCSLLELTLQSLD
jgi:capsular polysaccharide biosynthesis protein